MKIVLYKQHIISPCVYEFFDDRGVTLYAGGSMGGMHRPLTQGTKNELRSKAYNLCSRIEIVLYATKKEAEKAEQLLIHEKHPIFNTRCRLCRQNPGRPKHINWSGRKKKG